MKKIIFINFLFLTIYFNAQPPNGSGSMMRSPNRDLNTNEKPREFNASKVAGIFYYNIKKTLKKLKVKDNKLEATIGNYLKDYNNKVQNLALLNTEKFLVLNELMKNSRSFQNRDETNANETHTGKVNMRQQIRTVISPVRKEIKTFEYDLNTNMEVILSEKQFNKWLKYQKSIKDDLKPTRQQFKRRDSGNGGFSNERNQRGAMRF